MRRPTHSLLAFLTAAILGGAAALAQDAPPTSGGPSTVTGTSSPVSAPPTLAAPRAASIQIDGAHSHPATEAALTEVQRENADLKLIVAGLTARVKALEEAKPAEPPPPPPTVYTLVAGPGAEPNPEPVDVAETNAKYAIAMPRDYRSAILAYGASRMDLNYYDNTDSGPIARVVLFSLDGGPWLGGRTDTIVVPADLPDGAHQVRTVMYPPSGMSVPLPPSRLLKATVQIAGGESHTFIELQ